MLVQMYLIYKHFFFKKKIIFIFILLQPVEGINISGDDRNELIFGTNADDVLEGNDGNDVIIGLGGDDKIFGHAQAKFDFNDQYSMILYDFY